MAVRKKEITIPTLTQIEREKERLNHSSTYKKAIKSTLNILMVVAAAAVLIAMLFMPVLEIEGNSMAPNLNDGEIVILAKTDSFKTGQIVGFYFQNKILLKRVIAQAGDWVQIDEDGTVFVNDQKLTEPYVVEKSLGECNIEFPYQVPDGKIFVMGDHRSTSIDSRNTAVGCVDKSQIVGRVLFRIWPVKSVGPIK